MSLQAYNTLMNVVNGDYGLSKAVTVSNTSKLKKIADEQSSKTTSIVDGFKTILSKDSIPTNISTNTAVTPKTLTTYKNTNNNQIVVQNKLANLMMNSRVKLYQAEEAGKKLIQDAKEAEKKLMLDANAAKEGGIQLAQDHPGYTKA